MNLPKSPYIGRFAPSPSGQLHFGSLITAVASFLDARAQQGKWLVRMEDIDEPRCVKGVDEDIKTALSHHGLDWDGDIAYQSQRHDIYQYWLEKLAHKQLAYGCDCTRKIIKAQGGVYAGYCRDRGLSLSGHAIRVKLPHPITEFHDAVLGDVLIDDPHSLEDTVIKRRDGLYAYNLVVVVDDIEQGVTHIVRGSDLLPTTATHLSLYEQFEHVAPRYAHLPVASLASGRKLSKQNHATPIDHHQAPENLIKAFKYLGLPIETLPDSHQIPLLLDWAIAHWNVQNVPKVREIIVDCGE